MVSRNVEPRVKEHLTVAAREDKAVAVKPQGGCRIVAETTCAVEHSADVGTAKREAEVARTAGMNRIDRESTSLGRCLGENIYLHKIRCTLPLVGFSLYIIKSCKACLPMAEWEEKTISCQRNHPILVIQTSTPVRDTPSSKV